uniref:Uncharacterized protein n=1 Tax=Ascaris lumbricoides TaxID=6252 RepID=A0A0M3HXJ3_ASCLU
MHLICSFQISIYKGQPSGCYLFLSVCILGCHYKPFAERRANSTERTRFAFNDNLFPQQGSRMSNRSEPVLRVRARRMPSADRQMRPNSAYERVPSKLAMSRYYQAPLHRRKIPEVPASLAEILPEVLLPKLPQKMTIANTIMQSSTISENEETSRERINMFKDSVLSEIITRGVFTDRFLFLLTSSRFSNKTSNWVDNLRIFNNFTISFLIIMQI